MLNRKKIRWIITPVLAALLFSAAGATQESEQVLLEGDQIRFEPISTEMVEINGVPTLTKTFELSPEVDPSLLREEPFSQIVQLRTAISIRMSWLTMTVALCRQACNRTD